MIATVTTQPTTRLLRLKEVLGTVGLSRSTVYELMKQGEFPAQIKLGSRSVAWKSADIAAWIATRPVVR